MLDRPTSVCHCVEPPGSCAFPWPACRFHASEPVSLDLPHRRPVCAGLRLTPPPCGCEEPWKTLNGTALGRWNASGGVVGAFTAPSTGSEGFGGGGGPGGGRGLCRSGGLHSSGLGCLGGGCRGDDGGEGTGSHTPVSGSGDGGRLGGGGSSSAIEPILFFSKSSSTTGLLGSYHPCLGVTPGGRCVLSTGKASSISVTNSHGSRAQSSWFSTHWNQLCTPGCVTCPLHIHCTSTSWSSNSWVVLSSGKDNSGPANHVPESACHNQNGLLSVLFAL